MPGDATSEFPLHPDARLGAWALHEEDSGVREHPEPPHPYRTCFQRDRDRIVHCSAFRRLDFKTQVFVPHEQDHHRTRLTHTLEVAQVARTLARALRANEDATEAAALAHDLGHAPFGHAGEAALDELMPGHGGFEHNRQTLRVVEYLEHPYPDFRGLNLTVGVRRCLAKHGSGAPAATAGDRPADLPPLEGQLVDLADEVAYTSADLSDALWAGWISTEQLDRLDLWRQAMQQARGEAPQAGEFHARLAACRKVLDLLAGAVIEQTAFRLERLGPARAQNVRRGEAPTAAFDEATAARLAEMKEFLRAKVYEHPIARGHDRRGRAVIRALFAAYLGDPRLLPERYARRADADGLHRVVCDYIAGMTDRFCRLERRRVARTRRA